MDLEIVVRGERITVSGDLDAHAAPRLAATLSNLCAVHGCVVVDASAIGVFGAAGARVLWAHYEEFDRGVVVEDPAPTVRTILEVLELTELIAPS